MDKRLQQRIVKAMRIRRAELQFQLRIVIEEIEVWDPDPDMPRLKPIPMPVQNEKRLLELATDKWQTSEQFRKKSFLSKHATTRALNRLVDADKLERVEHARVVHYRLKSQTLRLVAGVGELK